MSLLDIPSVTSTFRLKALKFAHLWHSKALPNISDNYFQYPNDIHIAIIRDTLVIEMLICLAQGPTLENNLYLQLQLALARSSN